MKKSQAYSPTERFSHGMALLGAVVLLVAISIEIISGDHQTFSSAYKGVQLVVCLLFLGDWWLRFRNREMRGWGLVGGMLFLLLAIPWLNIAEWCHWPLSREAGMAVATMPLLRCFLALYLLIAWMIEGHAARRLFWAYVLTVVLFTYLSALLFYDYEAPVNPHLKGFGNALWWAWMNVTTVGAAIFPVTTIGKVICVLLPILGMAMFPIFTVYVTTLFSEKHKA